VTPSGPPAPPVISVVIPTYGRPLALKRCLASLARQMFPLESVEIIVVDDGGTPPVEREELGEFLNLSVVRHPHGGAGSARMAGVAVARAEVLAFLDDDCSVPPDYLQAVERTFGDHPPTRVAQVRILHPELDNPYGRLWTYALDCLHQANVHSGPDGRLRSGTLGGVMIARREVFTRVGFDPAMDVALEDADLRRQLHAAGIDVHYAPEVRVYHHVPRTLRGFLGPFVRYGRGAVHLRRKWGRARPPFRACSVTGWRDLRALVRSEGLVRGPSLYGVLWMRRLALALGSVYEIMAPPHGRAFAPGRLEPGVEEERLP
jgi:glycosyltransferase involved in cell wall biosynthesis